MTSWLPIIFRVVTLSFVTEILKRRIANYDERRIANCDEVLAHG